MAELKTRENDADVDAFLASVEDEVKRADSIVLKEMMERITGAPAKMWGSSIVGFDSYEYTNTTGKPQRWMLTGFSPRKANLSVYIMNGFDRYKDELAALGKHKTAKSCLYIKRLSDVDLAALEDLVAKSVKRMREVYG
ncbi:DUF1801 domain-containing protein [Parvularcula lutaonensis]|uniref:DUF1801 domain-containing protein n=1 Tax=Parvularcula lutaonensis TaxID=491923 RepID=A0ABV7ME19_9PROT|nr:DUF1801 domain-containing protein [Parvularcula lutaonensis]GGY50541.1 hypothetical protein GCM10007148_19180 [Parvularcula lutaonensis]